MLLLCSFDNIIFENVKQSRMLYYNIKALIFTEPLFPILQKIAFMMYPTAFIKVTLLSNLLNIV